jgi:hypothetical protein
MMSGADRFKELGDAAVEKRLAFWIRAGKALREKRIIAGMIAGVAIGIGAAAVMGIGSIFGCAALSAAAVIGIPTHICALTLVPLNVRRLSGEKQRRDAAAAAAAQEAERLRLEALANMPDLGHDFRLGISRDVGVKPALQLKRTRPFNQRPT